MRLLATLAAAFILAMVSSGECHLSVEQKTPPCDTGFDWKRWIGPRDGDVGERAVARLFSR